MSKNDFKILAIESSCDETAAAVIGVKNNAPIILSSVISSQADLHAKTGGVVPEVASRAHMEAISPVIAQALAIFKNNQNNVENEKVDYSETSKILKDDIDYIAVTAGPGLIGSLLVGYNAAKTISYSLDKPIIPINHIEGHIYSAFDQKEIHFPIITLTVSGGHTALTLMKDHGVYENLGSTLDDAAGEAFDKVAKLLGLGYPGGPIVSKLADQFRKSGHKSDNPIIFPRPILKDGTYNFSFSGLKTSVRQKIIDLTENGTRDLTDIEKQEVCAAFEDAAIDCLVTKSLNAIKEYEVETFVLAGGVAANKCLRETLATRIANKYPEIELIIPPFSLCGDNAAMIGIAAFYHIKNNKISNWDQITVDSGLEL